LREARSCTWAERRLVVEAALALTTMRMALAMVPFHRIARWLRLDEGEGSLDIVDQARSGTAVGWAVEAAAAHLPWATTCLMQSLAAAALLRRRHMTASLYLGVARDSSVPDGMAAHAWLRSGDTVLTGAASRDHFTVIGAYHLQES